MQKKSGVIISGTLSASFLVSSISSSADLKKDYKEDDLGYFNVDSNIGLDSASFFLSLVRSLFSSVILDHLLLIFVVCFCYSWYYNNFVLHSRGTFNSIVKGLRNVKDVISSPTKYLFGGFKGKESEKKENAGNVGDESGLVTLEEANQEMEEVEANFALKDIRERVDKLENRVNITLGRHPGYMLNRIRFDLSTFLFFRETREEFKKLQDRIAFFKENFARFQEIKGIIEQLKDAELNELLLTKESDITALFDKIKREEDVYKRDSLKCVLDDLFVGYFNVLKERISGKIDDSVKENKGADDLNVLLSSLKEFRSKLCDYKIVSEDRLKSFVEMIDEFECFLKLGNLNSAVEVSLKDKFGKDKVDDVEGLLKTLGIVVSEEDSDHLFDRDVCFDAKHIFDFAEKLDDFWKKLKVLYNSYRKFKNVWNINDKSEIKKKVVIGNSEIVNCFERAFELKRILSTIEDRKNKFAKFKKERNDFFGDFEKKCEEYEKSKKESEKTFKERLDDEEKKLSDILSELRKLEQAVKKGKASYWYFKHEINKKIAKYEVCKKDINRFRRLIKELFCVCENKEVSVNVGSEVVKNELQQLIVKYEYLSKSFELYKSEMKQSFLDSVEKIVIEADQAIADIEKFLKKSSKSDFEGEGVFKDKVSIIDDLLKRSEKLVSPKINKMQKKLGYLRDRLVGCLNVVISISKGVELSNASVFDFWKNFSCLSAGCPLYKETNDFLKKKIENLTEDNFSMSFKIFRRFVLDRSDDAENIKTFFGAVSTSFSEKRSKILKDILSNYSQYSKEKFVKRVSNVLSCSVDLGDYFDILGSVDAFKVKLNKNVKLLGDICDLFSEYEDIQKKCEKFGSASKLKDYLDRVLQGLNVGLLAKFEGMCGSKGFDGKIKCLSTKRMKNFFKILRSFLRESKVLGGKNTIMGLSFDILKDQNLLNVVEKVVTSEKLDVDQLKNFEERVKEKYVSQDFVNFVKDRFKEELDLDSCSFDRKVSLSTAFKDLYETKDYDKDGIFADLFSKAVLKEKFECYLICSILKNIERYVKGGGNAKGSFVLEGKIRDKVTAAIEKGIFKEEGNKEILDFCKEVVKENGDLNFCSKACIGLLKKIYKFRKEEDKNMKKIRDDYISALCDFVSSLTSADSVELSGSQRALGEGTELFFVDKKTSGRRSNGFLSGFYKFFKVNIKTLEKSLSSCDFGLISGVIPDLDGNKQAILEETLRIINGSDIDFVD